MLTLLLGADWTENRRAVFARIQEDVAAQKAGTILMVPELISHDSERRLCAAVGDSASRFAEVLTFTRLYKRVSDSVSFGAPECLDNGGRLVAMASAVRQLHSKLKAYAPVETRPEFLTGLLDAVDEFKRCCISAEDLYAASRRTEGSFAQKLEELSLILESYDAVCAHGKRDPRDQMTWLLEQLEDSDFAQKHTFYIDGFPDFTRQHTAILAHLMAHSTQVVVSLTCDAPNSENPAFEKAGATAGELLRIAKQAGVQTEILTVQPGATGIKPILPLLFQGDTAAVKVSEDALQACTLESVYQECHAAAERISALVRMGCRWRDISVVCTDMSAYANTLGMVLSRYHIPVYQSGNEDILSKTVVTTVLSAIDAAVNGFEQTDVLRYLKSPLSPLDIQVCDRLENYAIVWHITGKQWGNDWKFHPRGLGNEWTEGDREEISDLNALREEALTPLLSLGDAMKNATKLSDLVDALYMFLDAVALDERLRTLAEHFAATGDLRGSQILGQLWEILLTALEQLSAMLGDTHWDAATFTRLLKLLLGCYDVGTIPAVLDAVTVGPVSALRCQQPQHLIVLGANEGSFPAYSGSAGIFTDRERTALRQLGVPLTGGAMDGLLAEFADIYGVFCGADTTVYISALSGQPSFLHRRLEEMAAKKTVVSPIGIAITDPMEVGALMVRTGSEREATALNITDNYRHLQTRCSHTLGELSAETVQKLYGSTLNLSSSQIDKLADCRMAYFLRYGLHLKERKTAAVDPAEFGTYVHAVLERTGRRVMELGGFHAVTLEQTLEIADVFSADYIAERFSQIDSQRLSYLFRRNAQELSLVVTELWQELQDAEFAPAAFELAFGGSGALEAITLAGSKLMAHLRGFVDRVDTWQKDGHVYYRVVDYKTGKKDFDYCDIFNGLGLQMLLYLFALEEKGREILGEHPIASGVQYFPARAPIVAFDGKPDEAEAAAAREKLWRRSGLLLADERVLAAMESAENPKRLSYTRKKDGTISGDLADSKHMQLLKQYIFALLGKLIDDIASGCVQPNPYTRGSKHNACAFCPYTAVCRDASAAGRRDYAAMSSEKFWEEIERQVQKNG